MRIHGDDRRLAYFDVFPTNEGDLNIIRLYSGALSAWHRHQHQDDYFLCIQGRVKMGLFSPTEEESYFVLDEHEPSVFRVARNWWHGYQAFAGDAILVMWASNKWNGSDEERRDPTTTWKRLER